MKSRQLSLVVLLSLTLSACQSETTSSEESDVDSTPLKINYLQGKDGTLYNVSCLQENRANILQSDLTSARAAVELCAKSQRSAAERGFHQGPPGFAYFPPAYGSNEQNSWNFWGGVFGIGIGVDTGIGNYEYSGQSYAQGGFGSLGIHHIYNIFGYGGSYGYEYFGNGYFDGCMSACFAIANRPRHCARRRCLNTVYPVP